MLQATYDRLTELLCLRHPVRLLPGLPRDQSQKRLALSQHSARPAKVRRTDTDHKEKQQGIQL